MKRSEINALVRDASDCFKAHGWALPPAPKWDVTDFGMGNWLECGLVLVNLADEREYCEKLMYARAGMTTPAHTHRVKKEDIIARWGTLRVLVWPSLPDSPGGPFEIQVNGEMRTVSPGEAIDLAAGERVTLVPGVYHEFFPLSAECVIGEVSTANDDANDNFFANPAVGRFSVIEEDEPAAVWLVSDEVPPS